LPAGPQSAEGTRVAGAIRRAATKTGLDPPRRACADTCATYLTNKHPYLDYPTALQAGWPIATGVTEGACRHLVKDRMDLPHRRPLRTTRRRSRPQTPSPTQQRRLGRILDLPPQPRTQPHPPIPIRRQRHPHHPAGRITSLQKSRTPMARRCVRQVGVTPLQGCYTWPCPPLDPGMSSPRRMTLHAHSTTRPDGGRQSAAIAENCCSA